MEKEDKKQLSIGLLVGILTIGIAGFVLFFSQREEKKEDVLGDSVQEVQVNQDEDEIDRTRIYIKISETCAGFEEQMDVESFKSYCILYGQRESGFDILERVEAENGDFSFGYDEYDFGIMVTSFNGFEPDTSTHFWGFYVNDEMSTKGISAYNVKKGDILEFRVEEISF